VRFFAGEGGIVVRLLVFSRGGVKGLVRIFVLSRINGGKVGEGRGYLEKGLDK